MARQPTGHPNGRPPKSVEQKRRIGNPGGRPLPAPIVPAPLRVAEPGETVAPHRPLGVYGHALWERLVDVPWVQASDLETVLMVCEQTDERGQLRQRVLRDGNRFERAALRHLDRQISATLGLLGFDPSSRSRMMVAGTDDHDELDVLRARLRTPSS